MSGDRKCIVPKCTNTRFQNRELQLYAFPKDPEFKLKWMENIKIKKLVNKLNFVCSIHFEDRLKYKSRLKKNAIPTLHLGYAGPVPHVFFEGQPNAHPYAHKRKCCVESCKRKKLYKSRKVYKFPNNLEESYAWAIACNIPFPLPYKHLYVCERHFDKHYVTTKRLCPGAFPKFFLSGEDDEDVEQSDNERSNASDEELQQYLPLHQKKIEKLYTEIERLKKLILILENNAICPQPGSSAESLIFARMIVGSKEADYTEKEITLAKKLRSNLSSIAYRFMMNELECRLPVFKPSEVVRMKLQGNYRK